eukprot:768819-Lingulodinium_polyedra.AAC.1
MVPTESLVNVILRCMPAEHQDGWKDLNKVAHGELSDAAREAARWVEQNGAAFGLRPPNIGERSRVMGA